MFDLRRFGELGSISAIPMHDGRILPAFAEKIEMERREKHFVRLAVGKWRSEGRGKGFPESPASGLLRAFYLKNISLREGIL